MKASPLETKCEPHAKAERPGRAGAESGQGQQDATRHDCCPGRQRQTHYDVACGETERAEMQHGQIAGEGGSGQRD